MIDDKFPLLLFKKLAERTADFLKRKASNSWENYNFLHMCLLVHPLIFYELYIHAQCTKEIFVRLTLENLFEHLTYKDINISYPCEDQTQINENEGYQVRHLLPTYEKFVTMLYNELNKEYADNKDLLNLKEISEKISKIVENKGVGFSEEEMIEIIDRALHSRNPSGPTFIISEEINIVKNE